MSMRGIIALAALAAATAFQPAAAGTIVLNGIVEQAAAGNVFAIEVGDPVVTTIEFDDAEFAALPGGDGSLAADALKVEIFDAVTALLLRNFVAIPDVAELVFENSALVTIFWDILFAESNLNFQFLTAVDAQLDFVVEDVTGGAPVAVLSGLLVSVPIPEPGTLLLLLPALIGLSGARRAAA